MSYDGSSNSTRAPLRPVIRRIEGNNFFDVPAAAVRRCEGERDGMPCGTRLRRSNPGVLCALCEVVKVQRKQRGEGLEDSRIGHVSEREQCSRGCGRRKHKGCCAGTNHGGGWEKGDRRGK